MMGVSVPFEIEVMSDSVPVHNTEFVIQEKVLNPSHDFLEYTSVYQITSV
jgi:hypothetical protein